MDIHLLIAPSLGVVVGLLMGLTGAGGGIISVPLLIFFFGLEVNEAAPVGLTAVAISAGLGAILGFKEKILRYKAAVLMGCFGLTLSPLGLWLSHKIPNTPLIFLFCIVLMLVAFRTYMNAVHELKGNIKHKRRPPHCQLHQSIGKLIWTVPCARSLMFSGALAGFLSGLLGVGGGFILVPALKKFTDLPMKSIVATSLGVLTIVSTGSAFLAIASGDMKWAIAMPFIAGSAIGLLIGKKLVKHIHGAHLQQIFAALTFLVALGLIYKIFS